MRTSLRERVARLAGYVSRLEEAYQRHFVKTLFECFSEEERFKRFEWVSHLVYPESKVLKINNWMEEAFTEDMKRTPVGVAYMCCQVFAIDPDMISFLIKTAQRVKQRIRTRQRRHPERFAGSEPERVKADPFSAFGAFGALMIQRLAS